MPLQSRAGAIGASVDVARERILQLAGEHGARNVRVFGSVASGEVRRASDVDFLVDLEPGRTLLDLVGLRIALADLLDVDVDVATPDMLEPTVRETVRLQAVHL